MQVTLLVHIAAGGLAIVVGYIALFAAKGARLHRQSGVLFVYAMIAMGLSASVISVARGNASLVLGGLLPVYLVVTALTTVRPPTASSRRLDRGLALLALALGAGFIVVAIDALATPGGRADGVPAAPILLNGVIALLAGVGDLRVLRVGGLRGTPRLARHLWRMSFALFVASGSFFLGQADEIPEPLRILPLLAILAFLPLLVMLYWLGRIRIRRTLRGRVGISAPGPSVNDIPHRVPARVG